MGTYYNIIIPIIENNYCTWAHGDKKLYCYLPAV